MNLSSPQTGCLYVIDEGPQQTADPPDFVMMFPNPGGSAQFEANQTIQIPTPSGKLDSDWFVFNEEVGAATGVDVQKDETSQRTNLKGKGEVLAGVVRLEHR